MDFQILWGKDQGSYWASGLDPNYRMIPEDWNVSPQEFYDFGQKHGWDQNAMYKAADAGEGYKWSATYADPDTQNRYLEFQRVKAQNAEDAAKSQAEADAKMAQQRETMRQLSNLSATTGAVSGIQVDNRPNVETGTGLDTAPTSEEDLGLGGNSRKNRGRRVSSNLGL